MNDRQKSITDLYSAYRDNGDDDFNARERVRADIEEMLELPLDEPCQLVDLEKYLKNGHPLTDEELDVAQETYEGEDE